MKRVIFLCLCFISLLFAQEKQIKGRAILIGINEYPGLTNQNLEGCENDIALMQQLLEKFSFSVDSILNKEAKAKIVLDKLNKLPEQMNSGEHFVLFFSGHGSQITDHNQDEADGKDEVLVMHDTVENNNKLQNVISDDQLNAVLEKLTEKGVHSTVIFDCCHSGTGVRIGGKQVEKGLHYDVKPAKVMGVEKAPSGVVFIAACQANEVTREYNFKGTSGTTLEKEEENITKYGLFTFHLVRAIEEEMQKYEEKKLDLQKQRAVGKQIKIQEIDLLPTYRSVFQRLNSYYRDMPNAPLPYLEGEHHLKLFSQETSYYAKISQIKRISADKKSLELNRGTILGVTPGSIFCIAPSTKVVQRLDELKLSYKRKERDPNAPAKHAVVIVQKASAFECQARCITDEEAKDLLKLEDLVPYAEKYLKDLRSVDLNSWHAIEIAHNYNNLKLNVVLDTVQNLGKESQSLNITQLPEDIQKKLQQLQKEKVITVVEDFTIADVIVRYEEKTQQLYVLWAHGDQISAVNRMRLPQVSLVENPKAAEEAEYILMRFHKIRNLNALTPPKHYVDASVRLIPIIEDSYGWWQWQGDKVLWDSEAATNLQIEDLKNTFTPLPQTRKVVHAPTKNILAVIAKENLGFWDLAQKKYTHKWSEKIKKLVFDPSGEYFACATNKQVSIRRIDNPQQTLKQIEYRAAFLHFSKDNHLIISSFDNAVLWNWQSDDKPQQLYSLEDDILAFDYNSHHHMIAISYENQTRLWDVANNKEFDIFLPESQKIIFNNDKLILGVGKDIKLYNLSSPMDNKFADKKPAVLRGHSIDVNHIACHTQQGSTNGIILVSADKDDEVHFWNIAKSKPCKIKRFRKNTPKVEENEEQYEVEQDVISLVFLGEDQVLRLGKKSHQHWRIKTEQQMFHYSNQFEHGQKFGIEFTNNSEYPLFPILIYLTDDLEAKLIFPPEHLIEDYDVPAKSKKFIIPLSINALNSFGREMIKVIATTTPQKNLKEVEYYRLASDRATEESATERTVFGKLLYKSIFGQKRQEKETSVRSSVRIQSEMKWNAFTIQWDRCYFKLDKKYYADILKQQISDELRGAFREKLERVAELEKDTKTETPHPIALGKNLRLEREPKGNKWILRDQENKRLYYFVYQKDELLVYWRSL
ncbi:caspase family protein [Candidatus Uabimicrobium amorphum]|uniref:Peptidase C14 caspase domain-containing protein n=1 Tax=Uabimicrobium amorphum TaxID=2596890 RepID=A0A5S9IQW1_UABAM|nr:caspase family protein [Candidatus Uabimicrobium amorphum]BBM86244.1 hypothetical protein UABAM_04630 [Candidatus Uabimicrobium amorphum]